MSQHVGNVGHEVRFGKTGGNSVVCYCVVTCEDCRLSIVDCLHARRFSDSPRESAWSAGRPQTIALFNKIASVMFSDGGSGHSKHSRNHPER
jgi:hypothetical protein